jgi:hypothetical protein
MYRWRIYEYIENNGESAIGRWLREEDISDRDRGQLLQKLDLLAMHGTDLSTGILAGPIASKKKRAKFQSHIYKLVVHGQRMLRPMLCRGPINKDSEFTLLIGAIEVGGVLSVDAIEAESRRQEILQNPANKRRLNGRYC